MREHLEGSFMKEDKFEQKIKSSLAEEITPSEELINNTKQGAKGSEVREEMDDLYSYHLDCFANNCYRTICHSFGL